MSQSARGCTRIATGHLPGGAHAVVVKWNDRDVQGAAALQCRATEPKQRLRASAVVCLTTTNAGSDIFLRSKAGSKIRIVCGPRNSRILRTKGAKVQLSSFMGFDGLAYCWSMIFSENGSHFSGSCSNIHAP
jgi:hypothetical protein